jgi:hypothetical protein
MIFLVMGEIESEFPIEGRLIVLSAVMLGFNPPPLLHDSYSLTPSCA